MTQERCSRNKACSRFIYACFALLFVFVSLFSNSLFAAADRVLILSPEAPAPYNEIFTNIISGIKEESGAAPVIYNYKRKYDIHVIQKWIDDHSPRSTHLILLGNIAVKIEKNLNHNLTVITGGTDSYPGESNHSGVSLFVSPEIYIKTLKELNPKISNIFYIYNNRDKKLLSTVLSSGKLHNIEITPIHVSDIETSAKQITNILDSIHPENSSIWFQRNVINLNTELIFPYVLEKSWDRKIPVFSDRISHTKRGFLFSIYPDFHGMGQEIGRLIYNPDQESDSSKPYVHYLSSSKFVLNVRTASHLEIKPSKKTIDKTFQLYPAK